MENSLLSASSFQQPQCHSALPQPLLKRTVSYEQMQNIHIYSVEIYSLDLFKYFYLQPTCQGITIQTVQEVEFRQEKTRL